MRVIAQAPCRIGLLGGGTDVGEYASKYGGICINLAINIRQKIELEGSGHEITPLLNIPTDCEPGFYMKFFEEMDIMPQEIKQSFDGEIESGLGSSAAVASALVGGLAKLKGIIMTKEEIAEEAWDIEVNKLGLFGGKQDQYAAVYGGANLLLFEDKVYRYSLSKDKIDKITPYMCLFYTGINRNSPNIQEGLRNIKIRQKVALDKIKALTYDGIDVINNADWEGLGYLLDEAWEYKKQSNVGISDMAIGRLYESAKSHGAIGGKILGSGGGGHMMFITKDPEKLISSMKIKHIPFEVDWEGLKVDEI